MLYALAPSYLERILELLRSLPENAVRQVGALVVLAGVVLIWIAYQIGV